MVGWGGVGGRFAQLVKRRLKAHFPLGARSRKPNDLTF